LKQSTIKEYLRKHLGVTAKQFKELVDKGMPTDCSEEDVIDWMIDQGIVQLDDVSPPEDVICRTPEDAAGHFGVSHTTIRNWMKDVTCPARKGFFPIKAIREWREQQNPAHRPGRQLSDEERRVQAARAEKLEIELAERRGDLVPLQGMLDLIRRSTARHKAILMAFPDRLGKRFKELGLEKSAIELARTECSKMIDDLCDQIARDLIEHREEDMADDDSAEPL
jgi:hypothetical protein